MHALGDDQRRACFEPVDTGPQSHLSRRKRFGDVRDIERDLNDRFHATSIGPPQDDCQSDGCEPNR
jgi:hypothetical protein